MTTIVYDHKRRQIACDSLSCSDDSVRSYNAEKWVETAENIFFFAGMPAHRDYVLNKLETTDDIGLSFEVDLVAIRFSKHEKEVYFHFYHDVRKLTVEKAVGSIAFGSGGKYAVAALDIGKTAKDSVAIASYRDLYTGGKVHVFCCKTGRFLKGSK